MSSDPSHFVEYMYSTLGLKLDPALDWTPLYERVQDLKDLSWSSSEWLNIIVERIESHKSYNVHNASFALKNMYDNFLGVFVTAILKEESYFERYANLVSDILRTLTFQNTETVDPDIIDNLSPWFQQRLKEHYGSDWQGYTLLKGLYHTPQLWQAVECRIQDTLLERLETGSAPTEALIVHRYLPTQIEFTKAEQMSMYFTMLGVEESYRLNAIQAQHFLTGAHHNTASWRAVIELLEQGSYAQEGSVEFEEQWQVIEAKLSTLVFDPTNSMAWELWRVLDRWSKTSEKVLQVYERMQKVHPEMHHAYVTYWPILIGVYPDDDNIMDVAAEYYKEHHNVVRELTSWELSN